MKNRVAIITTVSSFELYEKTSLLFPAEVPLYVIDGTNGMHGIDSIFYMFQVLKNKNIEWLIMVDEDVIINNPKGIFETIEYMSANNYSVCGIRDGGVIEHRNYNPFLINTFFSIINFKEILKYYNKKEVLKNKFTNINEFDDDLTKLKYSYDKNSLYEPYYCFYLWLRRKGERILFLDSIMLDSTNDKISNIVKDTNGDILLYHTWYARSYGNNEKHTKRINQVLHQINIPESKRKIEIVFKDDYFKFKKIGLKFLKRFKQKIKNFK